MMNKPAVNELQKKVGCRYMLVTTVAKRARQLLDNPEELGDRKPVSVACLLYTSHFPTYWKNIATGSSMCWWMNTRIPTCPNIS